MQIGIIIDKLYPGQIGGAEQYIRNVVSILKQKDDVKLVLFLNEQAVKSFEEEEKAGVQVVCVPYTVENVKNYYEYYITRYDIQVFFCPLFYVPYEECSIPMVTSILDIQYEYFPEYFSAELLEYRRSETKRAVEAASAVITISEYSKETIIEKLNVEPEKIFVTYLNADGSFDKEIDIEKKISVKATLPEKYIFYPANGWPHKNHKKLIDGFSILKNKYCSEYKLVLTGNAFNAKNELQAYIDQKGLTNDVVSLGYILQEDMPYIFANAEIMVFPSLFEGFGIPLVEAMRTGTPIACSSCGSVPEIAGDAALVFDANDAEDIAEKLHELESNKALCDELRQKGYERAKVFSWMDCAEKTYEVLRMQVEQTRRGKNVKSLPEVNAVVLVGNSPEQLDNTIQSIGEQEYPNKNIIVVEQSKKDKTWLKEIKKGIIVIIQAGQTFLNRKCIDIAVAQLLASKEDIVISYPEKNDFWGVFLKNELENARHKKYIEADKLSHGIISLSGSTNGLLGTIDTWIYGIYQQELLREIHKQNKKFYVSKNVLVYDNNPLSAYCNDITVIKEFIRNNGYLPVSMIDDSSFRQKCEIWKLLFKNKEFREYYNQIKKNAVEFDGISSDKWMSRKCILDITIDTNSMLTIKGENNVLAQGTELTISLDDTIIKKIVFNENGEFEKKIEFPSTISKGSYRLKLESSQVISFYKSNKSDIRALSYRIFDILLNGKSIMGENQ